MKRRRLFLLAISILMVIIALVGLAFVVQLPELTSGDKGATPADIAKLRKILAQDEGYIDSLETVVDSSRSALKSSFIIFLFFSGLSTAILLIPLREKTADPVERTAPRP